MNFVPIGHAQTEAYKIASRLRQKYSEWTVDRKPNETPIPYLRWSDEGARDAYWLICTQNKLPREA